MTREQISDVLSKYLPLSAVDICTDWVIEHRIKINITKSRASKYGDYRPPHNGRGHRITVNHDLNPYAFLVTFVHEVAHLLCEVKFKRWTEAHGREWKHEFQVLFLPLLNSNIFPDDVLSALKKHLQDAPASSCYDRHLHRVLKKYDKKKESSALLLEEIPFQSVFVLSGSRKKIMLLKGEKRRTRFICRELNGAREFLVDPLAEVVPIKINTPASDFRPPPSVSQKIL